MPDNSPNPTRSPHGPYSSPLVTQTFTPGRVPQNPLFEVQLTWRSLVAAAEKLTAEENDGASFESLSEPERCRTLRWAFSKVARDAAMGSFESFLSESLDRDNLKDSKNSPTIDEDTQATLALAVDEICQNFFEFQILQLTSAEKAASVASTFPFGINELQRRVEHWTSSCPARVFGALQDGRLTFSTEGGAPPPSDFIEKFRTARATTEPKDQTAYGKELIQAGELDPDQLLAFLEGTTSTDHGGRGLRVIAQMFGQELSVVGNVVTYGADTVRLVEEAHTRWQNSRPRAA